MFCVSPVFHEREMHLLNLEVSDSFNGNFIQVSKVIINICAIVAFMIPQHEIANFYWFIYLIRTFTENALYQFQYCYKEVKISYEAVSSIKCDTEDVQESFQIFDSILRRFILFFLRFKRK